MTDKQGEVATTTTQGEVATTTTTEAKGTANRTLFWIKELLAVCFWIYVVCKLFIFDIDIYLIRHIDPRLIWIADTNSSF